MINDLDKTLEQLLIKKVPLDPADVDICFKMPDREWASTLSRPTVNLYLYDIHENSELREFDWTVELNHDNNKSTKTRAPVRVSLSYLITVWTSAIEDEHRLLTGVLTALFRNPSIPPDLFQGDMAGKDYVLFTEVAQPDGVLKNPADFWGALDNCLKPSISYVVTIPLDLDVAFTAPIVSTRVLAARDMGDAETEAEERVVINGLVYRKGKPDKVISDATLLIKETGRRSQTDEQGRYFFRKLSPGSYTLVVSAPNRKGRKIALSIPSKSYDVEL